ncbi:MAG TPA: biopolymer transporter ExbD [Candidatus Tectomicrobia bacterium]|jgi:biopolymer transport protein ExbD
MRVSRQELSKARIEIIPMIDVIFFLLVFFMVSTLSMTVNRGLPVDLPAAGTAQPNVRENVNLTLTQDGGLFLDKEPISQQEIGRRVQAILTNAPQTMVLINADGQVRHSAVVDVIDELRAAGVSALAIAVKPDKRPAQ